VRDDKRLNLQRHSGKRKPFSLKLNKIKMNPKCTTIISDWFHFQGPKDNSFHLNELNAFIIIIFGRCNFCKANVLFFHFLFLLTLSLSLYTERSPSGDGREESLFSDVRKRATGGGGILPNSVFNSITRGRGDN